MELTNVADMPGYPTRKLLFGGPETLTKAAIVPRAHFGPPRSLRQDDSVVDRQSGMIVTWGSYGVCWRCENAQRVRGIVVRGARRHRISKAQLCC
jgi:hypothetical protein